VCCPTTFRSVVWAIWLMAAGTFSIAFVENLQVYDDRDTTTNPNVSG